MKKIGEDDSENNSNNSVRSDSSVFDYDKEQQKIVDALKSAPSSSIDSSEPVVAMENIEVDNDKGPAFPDPEENIGHTVHSKEFYEKQQGFAPAIEVSKKGFTGQETQKQFTRTVTSFRDLNDREKAQYFANELAKPATQQDLENLDESMIMEMPQIKADSFDRIIDMLNPKPKDKTIRFKWANCKNFVAGNLGRYLAIGFQVANVNDIDQQRTPTDPSMIVGTEVRYLDVILLKIPVIRLMELYKANVVRSIMKLGRVREKGIAMANKQFSDDLSSIPGASNQYNKIKAGLQGREPVEFFTPGLEESDVLNK